LYEELNAMVRRFWWGQQKEKHRICWMLYTGWNGLSRLTIIQPNRVGSYCKAKNVSSEINHDEVG
jgi:hypothetical protein